MFLYRLINFFQFFWYWHFSGVWFLYVMLNSWFLFYFIFFFMIIQPKMYDFVLKKVRKGGKTWFWVEVLINFIQFWISYCKCIRSINLLAQYTSIPTHSGTSFFLNNPIFPLHFHRCPIAVIWHELFDAVIP